MKKKLIPILLIGILAFLLLFSQPKKSIVRQNKAVDLNITILNSSTVDPQPVFNKQFIEIFQPKQKSFVDEHYWGISKIEDCKVKRSELSGLSTKWVNINPTGSMQPCIGNNIKELSVTWSGYSYDNLQVGDIVGLNLNYTFTQSVGNQDYAINQLFHRIVAKTPQGFITKGDNLEYDDVMLRDTYLTQNNYAGLVVDAR